MSVDPMELVDRLEGAANGIAGLKTERGDYGLLEEAAACIRVLVEQNRRAGAGSDGPHRLDGKLEPEAKAGTTSLSEASVLSIAVSLKRMADTIDGTSSGLCVTETLLGGQRSAQ